MAQFTTSSTHLSQIHTQFGIAPSTDATRGDECPAWAISGFIADFRMKNESLMTFADQALSEVLAW